MSKEIKVLEEICFDAELMIFNDLVNNLSDKEYTEKLKKDFAEYKKVEKNLFSKYGKKYHIGLAKKELLNNEWIKILNSMKELTYSIKFSDEEVEAARKDIEEDTKKRKKDMYH